MQLREILDSEERRAAEQQLGRKVSDEELATGSKTAGSLWVGLHPSHDNMERLEGPLAAIFGDYFELCTSDQALEGSRINRRSCTGGDGRILPHATLLLH